MPQPLRQWFTDITFGANALAERPNLALGIASVASAWTEIEVTLGILLSTMLHTEIRIGISMYLALKGSAAQDAVLSAAADAKLPIDLKREFAPLLRMIRKRAKERNDVVHGLWGVSPQLLDVLIHCPAGHFIRDLAQAYARHISFGADRGPRSEFVSVLKTYDARDFVEIISRLYDLKMQLKDFTFMIGDAHEQQSEPIHKPKLPPEADASAPLQEGNQTNPKERP
jgi:hypothetical protein